MKGEVPEIEKRRLHIDDNTAVLLQFNEEKTVIEHFRTLTIPYARKLQVAAIHSATTGVYSESFYRQFESFCDGVLDFRTKEQAEQIEQFMRIRFVRGASHDSGWRRLVLLGNGEVAAEGGRTSAAAPPSDVGMKPEVETSSRPSAWRQAGRESGRDEGGGERRLAAIMFTDMVGFTSTAEKDEALAMGLLEEQRAYMRPFFSKHNGREVKTVGDAFLVEFASSLDAVKCALEAQSFLKEKNAKREERSRILVRIGIHLGDVIHTTGDVAGDAVNIASRVEPLAWPGGICVTEPVYESVVNKVGCSFQSLGTPDLKNVARPIQVYRVASLGEGQGQPLSLKAAEVKERIAILPFANISPDPADEYFADGMTEELISTVSKLGGLRVIARTSVMRFKGKDVPASQIGRELGVSSFLEGSVRKQGRKLRIAVQLVDAKSEEPRWSNEYDRELRDVFEIQRDIGTKVAEELKVRMTGGTVEAARKDATSSLEAYEHYLRGRQLWNRRTRGDLFESIRHFEKALAIDPRYSRAYSGLADAYAALALLEFLPPKEAFPRVKESVRRALDIDDELAEAHTSLGLMRFQYDWDWHEAEDEFHGAIGLNGNYAPAHQFFADYLKAMGRFDEAIAEMERARELDPLSLAISAGLGHVLYLSRQYDKAIERYRMTVDLDPNYMQTHLWFGRPYLEKGMYDEAISELRTAVRLSGESTLALGMLGHGLASAGKREEAQAVLDKLMERSKEAYVPSYWVAAIYNGMKDREEAIRWLRKAFQERSSWLVWVNVEPRFDWLRKDPGFISITKAMKFPSISSRAK